MKTKKKRVLGILLSLALVIGMVPSMGMTVHAKDNLVGTVITIGDTLEFDNDYIQSKNLKKQIKFHTFLLHN